MADAKVPKASGKYFQTLVNSTESFADEKVCVIGIFGKGSFGHKSKAFHVNSAVEKNLFDLAFIDKYLKNVHDVMPCKIEVYHDMEQRIIYLHLQSLYDASHLANLAEQAHKEYSNSESHRYWKTHEYYHACAMVFLFSVCHIMVLVHPTATFDLNYVRLFRALATARHQLLPQIAQCLNTVEDLPDIWRQTGRPCIPRLICSFKQIVGFSSMDPTSTSSGAKDTYASRAKVKTQNTNPLKKLQHSLEDQIYSILRKARLLGSLSSSSLFTVSSNHAFVHVQPNTASFDPINILLNKLAMPAIKTKWAENSSLLKGTSFTRRINSSTKDPCSIEWMGEDVLFKDYLKQQIDHLMTGDAGRDGVAEGRRGTHVEVCTKGGQGYSCKGVYKGEPRCLKGTHVEVCTKGCQDASRVLM
ncbi:predicted protein [Nematostella vectensis]|uniref:Nonsense-mediated mRNA decay factor SMG8 n=1 Tax=Nematostella vectensis TaxID=45351 RepID=A7S9H8_NEMVE|nr:predicted protein [Nematostella vectensis]|eukprot:XP_001631640.1 predicted protein [Nematostella vectensis]